MLKTTPGWEFDVERGPDWLMVKVRHPRGDTAVAASLAEAVWSLLEQHLVHRLVLEMDQIRVFDDDLVDQLIGLHERVSNHGGLMRICGLSPYNRQLLLRMRLDDKLIPYGDREEAVLGCSHPPRQPR
jgi:anti-anti-sigma regulatory factor